MRSKVSSSVLGVAVLAQLFGGAARGQDILVFSEVDAPVPRPKVAVIQGGFVVTWNDGAGRRYALDGNLSVLDPLCSLLLLFAEDSLPSPPPPFPEPGADPTADDLGCSRGL